MYKSCYYTYSENQKTVEYENDINAVCSNKVYLSVLSDEGK